MRLTNNVTGFSFAIAVAMGSLPATAPPARSAIISYQFAPGSTTVWGGDTEAIAGSFTFDTATNMETNVTVTLTGLGQFAGTYGDVGPTFEPSNEIQASASGGRGLNLLFQTSLGNSTDVLQQVQWSVPPGPGLLMQISDDCTWATVTSSPAAVPEPSSIVLLGAALGLFLLIHGAIRRERTPRLDQPKVW